MSVIPYRIPSNTFYDPWRKPLFSEYPQINWAHPLAKGLVGCWLFNEGSGNRVYDLCRSSDGLFANISTGGFVSSERGPAVSLNSSGSSERIGCGVSSALDVNNRITMMAYVNFRVLANYQYFFSKGMDVQYQLDTGGTTGSCCRIVIFNSAGSAVVNIEGPAGTLVTNKWLQVIGTYDGTNANIYVNGVLAKQGAVADFVFKATTNPLELGNSYGNNNGVNCLYLMGGLWNRALTPQEVSQLYQSPYAMFERRPVWMNYTAPAVGLSIPVAMLNQRYRRI